MAMTFVFLGLAYYRTYRDRKRAGKLGFVTLFGTTALSIGLVLFTVFFR